MSGEFKVFAVVGIIMEVARHRVRRQSVSIKLETFHFRLFEDAIVCYNY